MFNIETFEGKKFTPLGKQKKKTQIVLSNTFRPVDSYLSKLKFRYNGKYTKIPNFIVTREGKVIQLLNSNEHSNYLPNVNLNRNSVVVALENLGWLEKEPLTNNYINWIGDIYNGPVYEKKWRDYFFWHPYTSSQIEQTSNLCKMICNEVSIKKDFIGHNTKINGIEKFEGIVSKSNYDSDSTDLSPSFEFENFIKKIHNEQ